MLRIHYSAPDLDVDYYPGVLQPALAEAWFNYFDVLIPNTNQRRTIMFGNKGTVYHIQYRDTDINRTVIDWNSAPGMNELKQLVENLVGCSFTVCAVQRYPHGGIGIKPHRDKEMVPGTTIVGLSLGATRTLTFTREGYTPVSIKVYNGSIYAMKGQTNHKWLHSIETDDEITTPRISATFRDYRG